MLRSGVWVRAHWASLAVLVLILGVAGALVVVSVELFRLTRAPQSTPVLDQRVILVVPTLGPVSTHAATASTLVPARPSPTSSPTATQVSLSGGDVIQTMMRSVVQVRTEAGLGTGFRVAGGSVPRFITNAHVVAKAKTVVLITSDGRAHPAIVLGQDDTMDLALLGATDLEGIPPLALADAGPRTGDPLYVVGFALGSSLLGDPTVTRGIVSGRRMVGKVDYVQTDAAMNPGNSGGPTAGTDGKVVGVATWGIRQDAGMQIQGVNFAIPASAIRDFLAGIR